MHTCYRSFLAPLVCLSLAAPLVAQAPATPSTDAAPAMKLPADQTAYKAANTLADPLQRTAALQRFVHDFPNSQRAQVARHAILRLRLDQHCTEKEAHALAKDILKHAGNAPAYDENGVAYELAMAPGNGIDLKSANHWSDDSLKRLTLASIAAELRQAAAQDKDPPPSVAYIHEYWASNRSSYLQTLGEIQFRRGKLDDASRTLADALALDPSLSATYSTLAEVARARHNDAQALQDLESEEMYGQPTAEDSALMARLYAAQHGGSTEGLEADIDRRYNSAVPAFTPPAHTAPPASSRPVLVELFTGSGCPPCVAADVTFDALLKAYPSADVIALALDMHNPLPDPLSNSSALGRARFDSIRFTPSIRIDGKPLAFDGGSRAHAAAVYTAASRTIDAELSQPSGISLQLTIKTPGPERVHATANVRITNPAAIKTLLNTPMPVDEVNALPSDPKRDAAQAPATAQPSHLVLNFALVRREIRYSGENGIRFHQNVVRSIARPSAEGFPVSLTGDSSAAFTFDLPAITASLDTYLADFSKHSDRSGTTTFRQTDTALPPRDLSVAAWVEDPVTHHVLAAAITPVDPSAAAVQQASR